ncbi:MAG: sn-glycerol-3-phosphate ABC transporter ATP-binding protein UgpC [Bifidobacteriaceae bacterium]|jgi:multiple sugar transport system ATP-binding protein|nr:sn-glycerol-3-phosphate ABC transporter ATP-binding protein UgpC [Bifidobacteriaceae bacterium]
MATVSFKNVQKIYPNNETPSVDNLNLEIKDGEFLVLVGPSGCGKSTSLRMLAGLEEVTKGQIFIGEKDVTQVAPKDRDIAMVFQNYALYPHMSVAENMGFALKIAGMKKEEIRKRVEEAADILDLKEFLDRKPKALSGGQRQRVAMGRAIVRNPKVFLMDEPLSNLDAKLRVQTRSQIATLQRKLQVTTIYVTHDQTEALTMGDRIAVLNDGVLQQLGTPIDLYDRPANTFVAGFIGSPAMNIASFAVNDKGIQIGKDIISIPKEVLGKLTDKDEGKIVMGFRPEAGSIAKSSDPDSFEIVVDFVEDLGSDAYIYGKIKDSESDIIVRIPPRTLPEKGATVSISIDTKKMHLFSYGTGERLN